MQFKIFTILSLCLIVGCGPISESSKKAQVFTEEAPHYRIRLKKGNDCMLSGSDWERQLGLIKERAFNSKNEFNKISLDQDKQQIVLDLVSYKDTELRRLLTSKGVIEIREVYLKEELTALQESLSEIQQRVEIVDHFDVLNVKGIASLGYCRAAMRDQIMDLLEAKKEAGLFPKDLNFVWGLTPSQGIRSGNKKDWFELYAINDKNTGTTINNSFISKASPITDPMNGGQVVQLGFDAMGAKLFAEMTQKAANNNYRPIAIILDNEVISAPTVRAAITGGMVQISGEFSVQEAMTLASMLQMSPLLCSMQISSEDSI